MFSVCADVCVVWYFWCPGCRSELRFLYCDDVRLCCAHEMLKFFHGAPYAVCVELKNFYLFVFCFGGVLFVSCVAVCGCGDNNNNNNCLKSNIQCIEIRVQWTVHRV